MTPILKTCLLLLFSILIFIDTKCQIKSNNDDLNVDFEKVKNGLPVGWEHREIEPNGIFVLDSVTKKSGTYSMSIETKDGKPNFKRWAYRLPNVYEGKKMKLSGYVRANNVTEGEAAFFILMDPEVGFISSGVKAKISGTTDWAKYEIELALMPKKTDEILIGGYLSGKGKVWFDDFQVSIDGKDISEVPKYQKPIFPADLDKEFDAGSNINFTKLNANQVQNLKVLCLVWGFLKYYHPSVASGKYNWDNVLFRILPQIVGASNAKKRDEILVNWIEKLGEIQEDTLKLSLDVKKVKLKSDLSWIFNSKFSKPLYQQLIKVLNAKKPNEHYYVDFTEDGNATFMNERKYEAMKLPDAGFRILSLFRYWNYVQYYFPYRYLIGQDWKNVLGEFIPQMIRANTENDYRLTMIRVFNKINDTHAQFDLTNDIVSNYFGSKRSVIKLRNIENKMVVVGTYLNKKNIIADLEVGDIITKVGNKFTNEIIKEKFAYLPASNTPTKLREVGPEVLRSNDSLLNVSYIRNRKEYRKQIKLYPLNEVNIYTERSDLDSCFKTLEDNIGYLNGASLTNENIELLWNEIKLKKGLIIDLRNHPYFSAWALAKHLLAKEIPFVKASTTNYKSPGLFVFSDPISIGAANTNIYKGKVVVLIDERTQSSGEFHAMAYKVGSNVTLVGSTTAGADGNWSEINLPGNINSHFSGLGIYYPDGQETQRIGILPQIVIKPTIKGIISGKDELIQKAIEIMK